MLPLHNWTSSHRPHGWNKWLPKLQELKLQSSYADFALHVVHPAKHKRSRDWARSLPRMRHTRNGSTNGDHLLYLRSLYECAEIPYIVPARAHFSPLLDRCCAHGLRVARVTISQPNYHSMMPVTDTTLESLDSLMLLRRRHVSKPSGAPVPLPSAANPGCISMPS